MALTETFDVDFEAELTGLRNEGRAKLAGQAWRAAFYEDYYDGTNPTGFLRGDTRDIFRALLPMSKTNWSELVVNAVAERLRVESFSFGESNQRAWDIWQASNMDSVSEMVQTDALVCGATFVSVWPDEENPTGVIVCPEHPSQTVLIYRRRRGRRVPVAAYKAVDEGGEIVEQVFTDREIVTWEDGRGVISDIEDNPVGRVPVVELAPQPQTVRAPRSELHSVTAIQDRINLQIYNRLVASDFGAFRQITATGITLRRGADGAYEVPFNVGADRLLASSNPDTRFGVIAESDLTGYLRAVEADVQHLAAITQTPPHYLLGQMVNLSADALKAAEVGLVAKVKRRMAHLGEAWEQVMRLALGIVGDPAAGMIDAECNWADPESRSEGQLVDALVKMRTLNVPLLELWRRWGASPQEIERWQTEAAAEESRAALTQAVALGVTNPYAGALPQTNPEGT